MTDEIDAGREEIAEPGVLKVPLFEEEARVGKRQIETERVRVTTHTDLVEEHVRQSLRTDGVEVTRVPVNRTLDAGEAAPAIRTDGNVTIIPVLEEIVVVEKRLVLKEEVHIRRESKTEDVDVPVTLRKQRAVVEAADPQRETVQSDNEGGTHGLT